MPLFLEDRRALNTLLHGQITDSFLRWPSSTEPAIATDFETSGAMFVEEADQS